jgi:type IV secretory pathway TraG/TraD family ATPase VirD4
MVPRRRTLCPHFVSQLLKGCATIRAAPMTTKLGTATWADPEAVERAFSYRDGSIWLGRLQNGAGIGYGDDRHVCLVSGSRSGKGTSSIVNSLCLWPGSIVVVDPKGENATVTAARRGRGSDHCDGMGQAVYVLDPFRAATVDDTYRARFNPFDALDPQNDETIDEAARLADALVVVHQDSKDPFWDESARALLKGLILHVLTAAEYEGRRNLITLRTLITRGDWQAVQTLKESGETNLPSAQGLLWSEVSANSAFGGIVAGTGDTFLSMLLNSPKQFESVLQVANRNTEFMDSPAMQRCLEASDFKLSDLKTSKAGVSIYLSLPQRYMNTHYRWLRMMIALTVTEMEIFRGRPASGAPVLMVLDEFAGLKRMEVIETAVAQIAGFGVKLFFVLQSLEQLKAVYKDNWETFLSNAGLKIFFGMDDHFSREYVSKLIGETEIMRDVRSTGESISESESRSESRSETLGESLSRSRSVSGGRNESVSESDSYGTNQSVSRSSGRSKGMSWQLGGFLGIENTNKQWSRSKNHSVSRTEGTSRTKGVSRTQGTSTGWSDSDTAGTSRSIGTTVGTTTGTTRGQTTGVSETLHKRALISPDEIGQMFARVDDPDDPRFPGLALVAISGHPPIVVRRVNYYEDPAFIGLFDWHPDHPARELNFARLQLAQVKPFIDYWPRLILSPHVRAGAIVEAGDLIASAEIPGLDPLAVLAPVSGRVHSAFDGEPLRDDDGVPHLFAIVSYASKELARDPLEVLAEARAGSAAVVKTRLEAARSQRLMMGLMFGALAAIFAVVTGMGNSVVGLGGLVFTAVAAAVMLMKLGAQIDTLNSAAALYDQSLAASMAAGLCDVRPFKRRGATASGPLEILRKPESETEQPLVTGIAGLVEERTAEEPTTNWAAQVDSAVGNTPSVPAHASDCAPPQELVVATEIDGVDSLSAKSQASPAGAVPFGMSHEEFNRLPESAQAALRAQALTTARQVEAAHGIPTAVGLAENLVQVGAPPFEPPIEVTLDSERQTTDEPAAAATELKSRQPLAIVGGIAAVLVVGVIGWMWTNRSITTTGDFGDQSKAQTSVKKSLSTEAGDSSRTTPIRKTPAPTERGEEVVRDARRNNPEVREIDVSRSDPSVASPIRETPPTNEKGVELVREGRAIDPNIRGIGIGRSDPRVLKAVELFREACDLGNLEGCFLLGRKLNSTFEKPIEAAKLFRQACDGKVAAACGQLGFMYYIAKPFKHDLATAAKLFDQSCGGGDLGSCIRLGLMYQSGEGVPQNVPEAVKLYRLACDGGEDCLRLAEVYEKGVGVQADVVAALKLYRKECSFDRGLPFGCNKVKELCGKDSSLEGCR